jgi:hypothetical protein
MVGWRGKSVGGKRNSSSSGFSEDEMANTSGNAIAHATRNSSSPTRKSPTRERFGFLWRMFDFFVSFSTFCGSSIGVPSGLTGPL